MQYPIKSNTMPPENSIAKNPKRIDITIRANKEVITARAVKVPITLRISGAHSINTGT